MAPHGTTITGRMIVYADGLCDGSGVIRQAGSRGISGVSPGVQSDFTAGDDFARDDFARDEFLGFRRLSLLLSPLLSPLFLGPLPRFLDRRPPERAEPARYSAPVGALDLAILKRVVLAMEPFPRGAMMHETPTGQHARRIWFLYEWLTGHRIDQPGARSGSIADVVDAAQKWSGPGDLVRPERV